ncbi:DUF6795 domain-containing protein [Marinimicrobium locisalis]|uniref:DUF6795 domain-containing protein n=1 Tax=Marinimicrobium locisalis TaxID=546022 RepID=UPI003221B955
MSLDRGQIGIVTEGMVGKGAHELVAGKPTHITKLPPKRCKLSLPLLAFNAWSLELSRSKERYEAQPFFYSTRRSVFSWFVAGMLKPLILILLALSSGGVFAMSLSDMGKVCLFSEMSGVLTVNGKPVPNVRLVRTAKWQSEQRDETVTDDHGRFHFPVMNERTVAKFLPMEFVASQQIDAHYDGEVIRVWGGVKRDPKPNAESKGDALIVACDLRAEESYIEVSGGIVFSRCEWNVEPDESKSHIWES